MHSPQYFLKLSIYKYVSRRPCLSARNVYFTAKDDRVGRFTVTEGLVFLVPIWIGLLYVLVQYGIPDY